MTGTQSSAPSDWADAISELCAEIRSPVRSGLAEVAAGRASLDSVAEAVSVGAGDVTFAIDVVAEQQVTRWLEREGARRPLSLMTEDAGWRHVGPAPDGGHMELEGFDHGGPRIAACGRRSGASFASWMPTVAGQSVWRSCEACWWSS
ncbi:MAG: hypothetical protein ACPGPE_16645, partial [Planctomycetota bacterium]